MPQVASRKFRASRYDNAGNQSIAHLDRSAAQPSLGAKRRSCLGCRLIHIQNAALEVFGNRLDKIVFELLSAPSFGQYFNAKADLEYRNRC